MADLTEQEKNQLATQPDIPMGFEDDDVEDMIIPRIKIVQALSPERKDKTADEGDIINSLTKDKYNGKVFIPVFKFNSNIWWRDRNDGGGIQCLARDGKIGQRSDGTTLVCASCRLNEFDNTKQGKDAIPKCTKYINFFGFFSGERIPLILSFGKTNYNEGRKMYSLAKVTMQNMWNYGYALTEKLQAKSGNEWYIIVPTPAGATGAEDREFAHQLFTQFRHTIQEVKYDMDDAPSSGASPGPENLDAVEY